MVLSQCLVTLSTMVILRWWHNDEKWPRLGGDHRPGSMRPCDPDSNMQIYAGGQDRRRVELTVRNPSSQLRAQISPSVRNEARYTWRWRCLSSLVASAGLEFSSASCPANGVTNKQTDSEGDQTKSGCRILPDGKRPDSASHLKIAVAELASQNGLTEDP